MNILVVAEHNNSELATSSLNTLAAAAQLGGEVHVLIAGHSCAAVAEEAARCAPVARVRLADDRCLENHLAENLAALVVKLSSDYSHVLAPATTYGKNFLPRAAALAGVALVSDIAEISGDSEFVRPIYAGNILQRVRSSEAVKFITIRSTRFAAAETSGGQAAIEPCEGAEDVGLSEFVSRAESGGDDRPELTSARIVVSGGRGLGSAESFAMIEEVAAKLGAAVGASRAAVDAGYVPNDYQVGQTGKVVAPDLYLAIGLSGAIQHLAGMKDSKYIAAINKDPDAPIFQVADYGCVLDLFEALPQLSKALEDSAA